MNYRLDKYGNPISALGFGCMRFPQTRGKINLEEAEREILTAFHGGVNYFDTAYIYPGSEAALGEIFEKNGIREQVSIGVRSKAEVAGHSPAESNLCLQQYSSAMSDTGMDPTCSQWLSGLT